MSVFFSFRKKRRRKLKVHYDVERMCDGLYEFIFIY